MIKNINNLLIELGPIAIKAFFIDLKKDLLENQITDKSKGSKKLTKCMQIIDTYCKSIDVQYNLMSQSLKDDFEKTPTG